MCGILGWISSSLTDQKQAVEETRKAIHTLRPRGPDGEGVEAQKGWLLGHTRLAILDLTEKAHQPMTDGRGGWLVYNGEIYNFKELREELQAKGYRFRSTGDTEVLLHAMREWGVSCLERLRGMFAFGWLDAKSRELILCRDRYGVKPLAYEVKDKELRFASDLHALRLLPGASREIDSEAAYFYMALGYVPSPHSILENVRKVKPGCYLRVRWSNEGIVDVHEQSYWSIQQIPVSRSLGSPGLNLGYRNGGKGSDLLGEFERRMTEAIRYRLVSDVPVGVLLSGGIDSSLVTALCREEADSRVPSFTLGFEDPKIDEVPFAKAIASQLKSPHHEFYIKESDVLKTWDKFWSIYDEPFADSSALPMVVLCQWVASKMKVVLTGDGGDETFAGYPWHRALDRLNRPAPRLLRLVAAGIAGSLPPSSRYRADVLTQADRVAQWSTLRTGLTDSSARLLPVQDAAKRPPMGEYFREWSRELQDIEDPIEWASRMDLLTYLPDDLMVKSDRAGMKFGLELREPLLDHKLTAWCLRLPLAARYNRKERKGKVLPRRVLERRLPKNLTERPKQGFTPPLDQWLKGPLQPVVQEALANLERGDLSPLGLPEGCSGWSQCAHRLNDRYQQFLWRVVCFSEWLKHHRALFLSKPT